jgi:hypothetical protein
MSLRRLGHHLLKNLAVTASAREVATKMNRKREKKAVRTTARQCGEGM